MISPNEFAMLLDSRVTVAVSASVSQCRSASVAVTNAALLPPNVPLCSPGSPPSSSRRPRASATGRP